MKRYLFLAALAAAAFVSCNKAEVETYVPDTAKAVKFTVENIGSYSFNTKAVAIGETGTSTVGIFAADLNATNVEATVAAAALTPSTPIYWGVGQTNASDFCAIYPYAAGRTSTTFDYELPMDQHLEDTFTYQDNLVSAKTSAAPADAAVAFTFKHPFAKMVININNQNAGGDVVTGVVVKGLKSTTQLNIATVPATVTLATEAADATAYAVSATTQATLQYALVLAPQEATPSIEVTTALGSKYTFTLSAAYTFEAGKVASTSLTLAPVSGGGSGITQTAVEGLTFTAESWGNPTNAANTPGTPDYGDYWYAIGTIYGTDNTVSAWAIDFPMSYGTDGKWTIVINYDESIAEPGQGLGLKLRKFNSASTNKWATQLGFYTGTGDDYALASGESYDQLHYIEGGVDPKNIRLAETGAWTLVLDGVKLTATKN